MPVTAQPSQKFSKRLFGRAHDLGIVGKQQNVGKDRHQNHARQRLRPIKHVNGVDAKKVNHHGQENRG